LIELAGAEVVDVFFDDFVARLFEGREHRVERLVGEFNPLAAVLRVDQDRAECRGHASSPARELWGPDLDVGSLRAATLFGGTGLEDVKRC
jgi:hypothetical protein